MTARSAALATANQLPQRSSRLLASTSVRRAGARSLVHDASYLPCPRLDAPAEVEDPCLPQRRAACAALRRAANRLRHVPRHVRQAVERQDGPELPADAHLHRFQAELSVLRVANARWDVVEEH